MTSTFQKYLSPPNLEDHHHSLFSSPHIYHDVAATSSSSSISDRNFLSLAADPRDENYSVSCYQKDQLHQQHDQRNFASNGGSCDMENESSDNGLKFSIWKKADDHEYENHDDTSNFNHNQKISTSYEVKWMSNTKMRLMQKMKNTDDQVDPTDVNTPRMGTTSPKLEDRKEPVFSDPMETDNSSNTTSSNNMMMSNINHPIRVCSDCNTTKTPLWRSGPQGPKSLCNACGIRQRKARRAIAEAAAAAANGTTTQTETKPVVLINKKYSKTPKKDKAKGSTIGSPSSVVSKFKNRGKVAAPSTGLQDRKICLEEFLLNLSKNLAFYTVFPQDEKEAAILLMALSFGHVHG